MRDGLGYYIVRTVMQARNGEVWVGTDGGGVSRFDSKKFVTLNTKNGFPHDFIRSLYEDSHGTIWIGTRGGLVQYDHGKTKLFTTKDGLSTNFIRSLASREFMGGNDEWKTPPNG
jgi:ligand-binding sensor domain-containing protein